MGGWGYSHHKPTKALKQYTMQPPQAPSSSSSSSDPLAGLEEPGKERHAHVVITHSHGMAGGGLLTLQVTVFFQFQACMGFRVFITS
jgi:hypothetical protein